MHPGSIQVQGDLWVLIPADITPRAMQPMVAGGCWHTCSSPTPSKHIGTLLLESCLPFTNDANLVAYLKHFQSGRHRCAFSNATPWI